MQTTEKHSVVERGLFWGLTAGIIADLEIENSTLFDAIKDHLESIMSFLIEESAKLNATQRERYDALHESIWKEVIHVIEKETSINLKGV